MWEKVINALLGLIPSLSSSATWPNAKDLAGVPQMRGRGEWNHKKKENRIAKSFLGEEPLRTHGRSRTLSLDCCMNKKFLLRGVTTDSLQMQ